LNVNAALAKVIEQQRRERIVIMQMEEEPARVALDSAVERVLCEQSTQALDQA
jgi:hypothetical protein